MAHILQFSKGATSNEMISMCSPKNETIAIVITNKSVQLLQEHILFKRCFWGRKCHQAGLWTLLLDISTSPGSAVISQGRLIVSDVTRQRDETKRDSRGGGGFVAWASTGAGPPSPYKREIDVVCPRLLQSSLLD